MQPPSNTTYGNLNGGGTTGASLTTLNVTGTINVLGGSISSILVSQTGGGALTFPSGAGARSGSSQPYLYYCFVTSDGPVSIDNPAARLYVSTLATTGVTTLPANYDDSTAGNTSSVLSTGSLVTSGSGALLQNTTLQVTGSGSSIVGAVSTNGRS